MAQGGEMGQRVAPVTGPTGSVREALEREERIDLYQARNVLSRTIHWYNHERLHRSLGCLRPMDYDRADRFALHEQRRRTMATARHARKEKNPQLRPQCCRSKPDRLLLNPCPKRPTPAETFQNRHPTRLEVSFLEASFLEASFLEASFLEASFLEVSFLEASFLEVSFLEVLFLEVLFLGWDPSPARSVGGSVSLRPWNGVHR